MGMVLSVVKLKTFDMKVFISFLLILEASLSFAQSKNEVIIVMVEDDRVELLKSLRFLQSLKPKILVIDANLECRQGDIDIQIADELATIENLLLSSEVVPFGNAAYRDIIACSYLYPEGVQTGFTNVIEDYSTAKLIAKLQLRNTYKSKTSYHIAAKIAEALDCQRTNEFLRAHGDTLSIQLAQPRRIPHYGFEDVMKGKLNGVVSGNTIVILSNFPRDMFLVREGSMGKFISMSPAEIYVNVAFEMIGR